MSYTRRITTRRNKSWSPFAKYLATEKGLDMPTESSSLTPLVTLEEIAAALQYSKVTLENWAYGRRQPPVGFPRAIKLAGRLRWRRHEVEAWLNGLPAAEPGRLGYAQDPMRYPRGAPSCEERTAAAAAGYANVSDYRRALRAMHAGEGNIAA